EDAWRVWCAATGLWEARHLAGAPEQEPDIPGRTSFWAAQPVPVDVTLRKRGTQSVRCRPAHVPDHRAARRMARQAAERHRALRDRAEKAIAGRSDRKIGPGLARGSEPQRGPDPGGYAATGVRVTV